MVNSAVSRQSSTPAGRPVDVPAIYLDVSRAREELGWEPRTTLEDGIAATLEFLETESSRKAALAASSA